MLVLAGCSNSKQRFDLLIQNGRIIDGTGNNWFYGDVGVTDGKISAIGDLKDATAKKTVDAQKLVVCPGFIDVHTHADTDVFGSKAENFVRDGVTTLVCGNCGGSPVDLEKYFKSVQQRKCGVDVATLIGHNSVLKQVKGNVKGELTDEQMSKAKQLVRKAMQDGAVGMSTGLIYTPGTWSSLEEIIELQKVAAEFGGIYASHMRNEGTAILDAIDEALEVGRQANCRVEVSHFKLPVDVAKKIGGSDTTLAKVLQARGAGLEVWIDQYPYTASSTSLSTMLPDRVLEKGGDEARKVLSDPTQVEKVLAEMKEQNEVQRGRRSMAYAVISSCKEFPKYVGLNIEQIAQSRKLKAERGNDVELLSEKPEQLPKVTMEDQYKAIIDIYLHGSASCVFHTMAEPEVENILKNPLVSVASDSGIRRIGTGQPHPRGYGTNARVLGHYVRERKLIPLEDAIRKMTSQPAIAFRFKDRGLIREGYVANLNIFDPDTIIDKATFEDPHHYSVGVRDVIVNGELVMENEKLTGKLPGRPVYGPGKK